MGRKKAVQMRGGCENSYGSWEGCGSWGQSEKAASCTEISRAFKSVRCNCEGRGWCNQFKKGIAPEQAAGAN
jgi:hypothetical protein